MFHFNFWKPYQVKSSKAAYDFYRTQLLQQVTFLIYNLNENAFGITGNGRVTNS